MGFATNSLTLPALTRAKGTLLISDALNHSSIVAGARGDVAGGRVRVFRHNDPAHLERVLRAAIAEGQPRTRRPWSKILVVVEGIYSMEGQLCRLAEIVEIKKRYKAYLYLDEAHSIGAMGAGGRGVTEALGVRARAVGCGHEAMMVATHFLSSRALTFRQVDPADVDVMMGTFTKSFGSCGGYVAGDEALISYLRSTSPVLHATTMSPPSAQQALSALRVISGADGTGRGAGKLAALRDNANFFRDGLAALGCDVLGDRDSPVCPLMLYNPAKIPAFSRACLERHLAVVVVGFPATPLLLSRTRFCVSASHTRDDLAAALAVIADIVGALGLRYGSARPRPAAEGKGAAGWGGGGAAGAALAAAPAEGGRAAAAAAAGGAGGGALANGHAKHA